MNVQKGIIDNREFRKQVLADSAWVAQYAPDAIDFLAENSRVVHLPNATPLASRTDPMNGMSLVISGGLRSTVTSSDGYEYTISFLRRGTVMGAISMVDGQINPLDVSAIGPTDLLVIRREVFQVALERFPSLYRMLAHLMAYRLRKAYAQMQALALDPIELRLKRALVTLAGQANFDDPTPKIQIRITQDELGHLVKSTRPTINRILKQLEQAGLLCARYGYIEITDIEKLRQSCDDEPIYSE